MVCTVIVDCLVTSRCLEFGQQWPRGNGKEIRVRVWLAFLVLGHSDIWEVHDV